MHCPNCGIQASIEQKFCRSCGMSLEAVSKAIVSHQSAIDTNKPADKDDQTASRRLAIMLFWGIIIFLLGGVIMGVSRRMFPNKMLGLLGLVMLMVGVVLATYAGISPLWQHVSKSGRIPEPNNTKDLESRTPTMPEALPAPPPSITEQTTNILETEAAKMLRGDSSKESET